MHTSAFPTVLAFSPSPPRLPFPVCLGGADSRFFVAFHELHFFIISLLHFLTYPIHDLTTSSTAHENQKPQLKPRPTPNIRHVTIFTA
jgi:hypothetical protein